MTQFNQWFQIAGRRSRLNWQRNSSRGRRAHLPLDAAVVWSLPDQDVRRCRRRRDKAYRRLHLDSAAGCSLPPRRCPMTGVGVGLAGGGLVGGGGIRRIVLEVSVYSADRGGRGLWEDHRVRALLWRSADDRAAASP